VTYTAPPAPLRMALPDDLRTAIAAASNVAPASGAARPKPPDHQCRTNAAGRGTHGRGL
jgi:hypothetical protein